VGATTYAWQSKGNESLFPEGTLEIVRAPSEAGDWIWVPCWVFEIIAEQPQGFQRVFVHAINGEIVKSPTQIQPATGFVDTLFDGIRVIETRAKGSDFILDDQVRNIHTKVLNKDISIVLGQAVEAKDRDNFWGNQHQAASAHWAAEMATDFFFDQFGFDGVDDHGGKLRIYLRTTSSVPNAFYKNFLGKDYIVCDLGLQALDVVGHELTHGVIRHTSRQEYELESGALNESFADIFGVMVEASVHDNHDWFIGESSTSGTFRHMASPNNFNDPDTYDQTGFWFDTDSCEPDITNDNCGVHTNSGVQNRWFSLLSDGGNHNGVDVDAIGIEDAGEIAFRNLTVYLTRYADYRDARDGSIDAAVDLFGGCSQQVESVVNAWDAVGLPSPNPPCTAMEASLSGPTSQQAGIPALFSVSVAGGTGPYNYLWQAPGGHIVGGSGGSAGISFSTTGTRTVSVRVSDAVGMSVVVNQTVRVH